MEKDNKAPTLDAGVPRRALRSWLQLCMDRAAYALRLLEMGDPLVMPKLPEGVEVAFGVDIPSLLPGTRMPIQLAAPRPGRDLAALTRRWILACAVRDMLACFHIFLEEMRFFAAVANLGRASREQLVKERTSQDARDFGRESMKGKFQELRRLGLVLPDDANERLAEVLTLVLARNCLEHRGGFVAQEDINGDGALTVRWRALEFLVTAADGTEQLIETGRMTYIERLTIRRAATRMKTFCLGEYIDFTSQDLADMCWSLALVADEWHAALGRKAEGLGLASNDQHLTR